MVVLEAAKTVETLSNLLNLKRNIS